MKADPSIELFFSSSFIMNWISILYSFAFELIFTNPSASLGFFLKMAFYLFKLLLSIIHNFINFLDNLDFISYSTTAF